MRRTEKRKMEREEGRRTYNESEGLRGGEKKRDEGSRTDRREDGRRRG